MNAAPVAIYLQYKVVVQTQQLASCHTHAKHATQQTKFPHCYKYWSFKQNYKDIYFDANLLNNELCQQSILTNK